jgi:hypothetical protein
MIFITCYNLIAGVLYKTIGNATTSELNENGFYRIYYFFPPIYIVASGFISILLVSVTVVCTITKRLSLIYSLIILILNLLYLFMYVNLILIQ